MLTNASQFTPRARSLQARHAAVARVLGAAVLQKQQTRGFRFGMWSSYLDDDFHRELRRRQRMMKHKYQEHINRRLSWEKHPFAEDARHALKRMMKGCWPSPDARPGGRYCDDAEPHKQQTPENEDGVRPGQNIEDVERGAMDHLMSSKDRQQTSYDQSAWCSRRFRRARVLHHTPYDMPVEQDGFIIDPITNRKVPKHPTSTISPSDGADIPVRTFRDYRSQFAPPLDDLSKQSHSGQYYEDTTSDEKPQRHDQLGSESNLQGTHDAELELGRSGAVPFPDGDEYAQTHRPVQSGDNQFNDPNFWKDGPFAPTPKHDAVQAHRPLPDNEATGEGADDLKYDGPQSYQPVHHPKRQRRSDDNSQEHVDIQRHKSTPANPHEQFEDLKPRYEDLEQFGLQASVADEIAKRFEDVETSDVKKHQSTTINDLNQDHSAEYDEADGHTSGLKGSSAKPFQRQYQDSVEQIEPGDFPGSTAEDLRKKYGEAELKQYPANRDVERDGNVDPAPQRLDEQYHTGKLNKVDELEPGVLRQEDQGAAARDEKSNYRAMLDSLMKQHERLSDAVDEEANLAVKSAKAKSQHIGSTERKLTGNYVRDFPEEFEKSWTQTLSSAPAETVETSYLSGNQTEAENMDGGLEGAFGRPTPPRIQPALDRLPGKKPTTDHVDPLWKGPGSLQTSPGEECSESTQPLLTKHHSDSPDGKEADKRNGGENLAPAEEQVDAVKEIISQRDDGPTRYRILAYDPVMQKVNMAETTSLVPDFTSALSPADALLRLSQPLKFFPFFATLEEEGFEIVSGSGDVLIFRQARPPAGTNAGTKPEEAVPEPTERPVNPIDMTGRVKIMSPASANFASPTGYVNYDQLLENEPSNLPPPPPRVKYNIDLRREEPVFSGPKYRADPRQKQKKSLGKRLLVGGVWVAGISYGLGVVSEYFTTGGVDGMGPTGF